MSVHHRDRSNGKGVDLDGGGQIGYERGECAVFRGLIIDAGVTCLGPCTGINDGGTA